MTAYRIVAQNVAGVVLSLLVVVGCGTSGGNLYDGYEEPEKRVEPLKLPASRLPRTEENSLLELLDEFRGVKAGYLERVKAEEMLSRVLAKNAEGAIDYVVPLLNDPNWDVRAGALRLLMRHGRDCPAAVEALVQVVGDQALSAPVRDGAAKALRSWTGEFYGYNAWAAPKQRADAVQKWKDWLTQSEGITPGQ